MMFGWSYNRHGQMITHAMIIWLSHYRELIQTRKVLLEALILLIRLGDEINAKIRSVTLHKLTISFRMLISLKSIRFSSSSMWLLRSTFTARWAPDSLWTHILTSPKAPISRQNTKLVTNTCDFSERKLKNELNVQHVRKTYQCRGLCQFCRSRATFPEYDQWSH